MPDLDAVVAEITPELMPDRARNLTHREVENALGGYAGMSGLTAGELDDLIHRITAAAYEADVTIDLQRGA